MQKSWYKLGKVGKAHGIRGSFFVSSRDELIPIEYREIYIGPTPETARPAKMTESRWQAGRPLISCTLAADRTAAETLTGQWIWVERAKVKVEDKSEYSWSDLVGKLVKARDGNILGKVVQVYNVGASDIVEIHGPEGRRWDIPLVEQFFSFDFTTASPEISLTMNVSDLVELEQD